MIFYITKNKPHQDFSWWGFGGECNHFPSILIALSDLKTLIY